MLEQWVAQGIGIGVQIVATAITVLVLGGFALGVIGVIANAVEVARRHGKDDMPD